MRLVFAFFSLLLLIILYQCASDTKDKEGKNFASDQSQMNSKIDGESLAKVHCSTCHLYPEPDLLDKYTWSNFVLIRMGAFLGIYQQGNKYLSTIPMEWMEPGVGGERIRAANIYPKDPIISIQEWQEIVNFYINNAPEKLAQADVPEIKVGIPFFKSKSFVKGKNIAPLVQSMTVDEKTKEVYAAEYQGGIYKFDFHGDLIKKHSGRGHVVKMLARENDFVTLDMATRFASDNPQGTLRIGKSLDEYSFDKLELVYAKLMRPVDFSIGDLTGNGQEDFVIAEYGNMLGALSWLETRAQGDYLRHELYSEDGAIKSEIRDLNGDGKNDIISLMGNSDEGIDWYINQGNGKFERKRKLRFLPTNGSTHFQLIDFDEDGVEDLLYSNGDNGDYQPLMKPYHGIHLYLNKNGSYEESFFLPLNGVYQAEAVDFDKDGDLDIAAVSFHPDFDSNQKEGFVIFENDGGNNFERFTISQYADARWMRFVTTDIDGDSDIDILLSAMNIKTPEVPNSVVQGWNNANESIILIENQTTSPQEKRGDDLFRKQ